MRGNVHSDSESTLSRNFCHGWKRIWFLNCAQWSPRVVLANHEEDKVKADGRDKLGLSAVPTP